MGAISEAVRRRIVPRFAASGSAIPASHDSNGGMARWCGQPLEILSNACRTLLTWEVSGLWYNPSVPALTESAIESDPIAQFARWFDEARAVVKPLPHAVA